MCFFRRLEKTGQPSKGQPEETRTREKSLRKSFVLKSQSHTYFMNTRRPVVWHRNRAKLLKCGIRSGPNQLQRDRRDKFVSARADLVFRCQIPLLDVSCTLNETPKSDICF